MKKIPTLFTREFENHRIVGITPKITEGCKDAFMRGAATIKVDGSCCAVIDGKFYKRYDAKKGKKPPAGAIPCCDPDPVTGHWPHWVEIDENNPSDKWFMRALLGTPEIVDTELHKFKDGTYEAVGLHFNGNPYGLDRDILYPHGWTTVIIKRDFDTIKQYLEEHEVEGLVFWLDGEPVCKIKRSDFGFEWPVKKD